MFMIISFAYDIDQMVFYIHKYLIEHGRIEGLLYNGTAQYYINGIWVAERIVDPVQKDLIDKVFHRRKPKP